MKAVVIEVNKHKAYGRIGRVIATCETIFHAETFVNAIEHSKERGIGFESPNVIGYIAARIDNVAQSCESEGVYLEE